MRAFLRCFLGGLIGVSTLGVNACGEGDRTIIVVAGGSAGVPGASGASALGGASSGGADGGGSGGAGMVAGAGGSADGGTGTGGAGGDGNAGSMATGGDAGSNTGGSNNGGSAGSGDGGSAGSTAGSAGSNNGGSAGSSGGSAGNGGSAGSGGSGGLPPICEPSISVNVTPCDGPCRESECGIQFLGLRDCNCPASQTYSCTSCDYTVNIGNPIIDPPGGPMVDCVDVDDMMEDRLDCGSGFENGYRCQSLDSVNRMCACWDSFWDCGSKPAFWASVCPGSIDSTVTSCTASCMGSRCGIFNVGVRDCTCQSLTYVCSACDYTSAMSHPLVQIPQASLPACDLDDFSTEDRQDCGIDVANGYRCQSIDDTNRLCACWNSVWDCASKPPFWP